MEHFEITVLKLISLKLMDLYFHDVEYTVEKSENCNN